MCCMFHYQTHARPDEMNDCTCMHVHGIDICKGLRSSTVYQVVSSILQSVSIWTRLYRQYEAATVVAVLARRRAGACR